MNQSMDLYLYVWCVILVTIVDRSVSTDQHPDSGNVLLPGRLFQGNVTANKTGTDGQSDDMR